MQQTSSELTGQQANELRAHGHQSSRPSGRQTSSELTNQQQANELRARGPAAGIRLAVVSTVGIATIAASINAGGLGILLFEGLRTMHISKILWGSLLSAGMAVLLNAVLKIMEERM